MNSKHLGIAILLAASCGAAASATAQTIRPVVAEYRNQARGRVELLNSSDRPLNVVLEVKGFGVDEGGNVHDETIAPDLQVKLSTTSIRIPAGQSRFVFYDATSSRAPSWFQILAKFSGYSRSAFSGVNVQLELPHFVYVLPAGSWKDADLQARVVALDREKGKLILEIENDGPQFGRVTAIDVRSERQKITSAGFPLFPQGKRRVEVPWADEDTPERIDIHSRDLNVERQLILERP